MALLKLTLLGGFAATLADGTEAALPTRKAEALLAFLALLPAGAAPRSALLQLLWEDRADEQARSSLRQALTALRRALGPAAAALVTERDTVALDRAGVEVDVLQFERLARSDETESLRAAADLYRDGLLEGIAFHAPRFFDWRDREAARLRGLAVEAMAQFMRRDPDHAPAVAERLLTLDPLYEPAHRLLMRHHGKQGRRALALQQYETCRQLLKDRLGTAPSAETEQARAALSLSSEAIPAAERPALAVLPFAEHGVAHAESYFADGLVEELVMALSAFRWLDVVAAGSSLALKGQTIDPRAAAERLGVRYVLRGSIRRTADRLRIAAELIDARTGIGLWAERAEGSPDDVFALQDRVSEAVAGAIAPRLQHAETERSRRKPPERLDAWDLVLRAMAELRGMTREGNDTALSLLRRAATIDPAYAMPLGLAAWAYTLRVPQRWADRGEAEQGTRIARQAIALGHDDADTLGMAGYALAFLGRDYAGGLAALDRGLELNPNSARCLAASGWVRAYIGDHPRAIADFERALRLSPLDPLAFRTRAGLAFAQLFDSRPAEAAATARRALSEQPDYSPAHRVLAASLAHQGLLDDARAVGHRLIEVVPGLTTTYALAETRFMRPQDLACLADGLRLAGLPE